MVRMFHLVCGALVAVTAGAPVSGETAITVAVDELVEGIGCVADPTQTYSLYLPPDYTPERRWPVLLVFDPRGRSVPAAALFIDAARDHGWIIVSSNDTRSDGAWEPNARAVNALWPEVHVRIPGDPKRIYAAGFSGGATVALALAGNSGEVAGVIACGGPLVVDQLDGMDAPVFGAAGNLDFNYQALQGLDEVLEERGNPRRMVVFDGAHTWMPADVARQAVEWLELLAMRRLLRQPDAETTATLYTKDIAAAEELVAEGRLLEAEQRFRAVARTFEGLHDISEALARADELAGSAEIARQRKEAKRWRAFERRSVERLAVQIDLLRTADMAPPSQLVARDVRIDELLQRKQRPGQEGDAVQRVLNLYESQFSLYLAREFLAAGRYDRAAISLELALRIREDNPTAWYNLACCRARLHRETSAVEALKRAMELGFDTTEVLFNDNDLDALRDRDDFTALLASRGSG